MKNIGIGIFLSIVFLGITSCDKNTIHGDIILTDVHVIDVANATSIPNQTVAIQNGKITSVTPFLVSDNLISDTIVHGDGKYVIPALWDMHTHYTTSSEHKGFLNLFVANGVLGVRDLWGNIETRDSLVSSNSMAPVIYLSGAIIDGSFTLLQGSLQPKSAEEAIRLVDSLYQKGADFIKIYDDLSVDTYKAIAHRCNELGLAFAGHVPMSIKADVASEMGQKSMEHLSGIFKLSTTQVGKLDSLEGDFKTHFLSNNLPAAIQTFVRINSVKNSAFDPQKTAELAKVLYENGTYVTPTLITLDRHWSRKGGTYINQDENKYISENLLQTWDPELNFPEKMYPPIAWETGKDLKNTSLEITKILHEKGVNILAGTDCGISYIVPGFSLHDELELLVKAGLSNADALKTATVNPAKYFSVSDSYGQVATGMKANVILLNANPLEDISNTKNIYGIVRNGTYLNRIYLDNLLEEAVIHK